MDDENRAPGERIARAALALVGVPFRLHGRSAATGVDCVGLCLLALRGAGRTVADPPRYSLRMASPDRALAALHLAGLARVEDEQPGDILLANSAPMQGHLMIAGRDGLIHADAGLGKVVLMPGRSPWPLLSRWRIDGKE